MFLRIVRAAGGQGVQHEYVRLVEAYREDGKTKHRVVCNLGRKDVLAEHLDALVRLVRGEKQTSKTNAGDVRALDAWDWGPMLVARSLWRELGLERIFDALGGRGRRDGHRLADRALVLVANRLCAPSSEHGLARWLETDFVCDRHGEVWTPAWREQTERLASTRPRVRVAAGQLTGWYRTLDQLQARKNEIERELYLSLRTLFSLKADLVFYDLTSTYFEGAGPSTLGAHGHSRDSKPRNRQVLVGLVMVDGWPIAHHVLRGNVRDATTVATVLTDLDKRFGIGRVIFVGDRGMVTSDNIALLRASTRSRDSGLIAPSHVVGALFAVSYESAFPMRPDRAHEGLVARDWRDDRIAELEREVAKRDAIIAEQQERIAYLEAQVAALVARAAELVARVADLEEKLRTSWRNSSMPPSSDGP
jgi:uncharacterized coiled-coil protein SlyX